MPEAMMRRVLTLCVCIALSSIAACSKPSVGPARNVAPQVRSLSEPGRTEDARPSSVTKQRTLSSPTATESSEHDGGQARPSTTGDPSHDPPPPPPSQPTGRTPK